MQLFLQLLVKCLFRHHGQPVVLLIDEYDVPLAKAAAGGYYDDMIGLIRPLLEEALKPDPDTDAVYLQKAVLTVIRSLKNMTRLFPRSRHFLILMMLLMQRLTELTERLSRNCRTMQLPK